MGNETSSMGDDSSFMREFKSYYDFTTELSDKRFGDVCIYRHKTEKKYIAKRGHMCNSAEEYQSFIRSCKQRQNLKQKSLLQLLFSQEANEDNICGDFNKITLYFEYYFHDLEKEILRRRENGQEYFSESELWYLLDSLVQVCSYLQKYKIYHGDLRPCNILLSNEGLVKIADHGILNTDQTSYFKMLSGRDKCYLSPTLLRSLQAGEHKPFHDSYKTDMYSLGMSILEAASLCPPMAAYDFQNFTISHPILEELLNDCRGRYSDFLVNVLMDMLQDDESSRPTFDSIISLLLPFQNSIQNNTQLQRNSVLFTTTQPVQLKQQIQSTQVYQQASQPIQTLQNYNAINQNLSATITPNIMPSQQAAQVALRDGSASFIAFNAQDPFGTQSQITLQQQPIQQQQIIQQIPNIQQQSNMQSQPQYNILQQQQIYKQQQQQQQLQSQPLNPWQINSPTTVGIPPQNLSQPGLPLNSLQNQLQQQQPTQQIIANHQNAIQPITYVAPVRSPANPHSLESTIQSAGQPQQVSLKQYYAPQSSLGALPSNNQLSLSPLSFQTPQQGQTNLQQEADSSLQQDKQQSEIKGEDSNNDTNSSQKKPSSKDSPDTVSTQGLSNNSQSNTFQPVQLFQQPQLKQQQQQQQQQTDILAQIQQQQQLIAQLQQQQLIQNQLLAQQKQQQQQLQQSQQQIIYQPIPSIQQNQQIIHQVTGPHIQQQQSQQPQLNQYVFQQSQESFQQPQIQQTIKEPSRLIPSEQILQAQQQQQQQQYQHFDHQASVQLGSVQFQPSSSQQPDLARLSNESQILAGQYKQSPEDQNNYAQSYHNINPALLQNYALQLQQQQLQQQQLQQQLHLKQIPASQSSQQQQL